MGDVTDPATLAWAAKFSNVPSVAAPGASAPPASGADGLGDGSGDPPPVPATVSSDQSGQLPDPNAGPATAGDPAAAPPPGDPAAAVANAAPDPGATAGSSQPTMAGQGDAPASGAELASSKTINVTIVTSYGQTVRYWIQDRAIDASNEAAEGSGTALINGDDHGPGESIGLSCIEMANGASICYRRESYPNPPGGGLMPWSSVSIKDGDTFTIQETGQTLEAPSPAGGANAVQTSAADPNAGPATAGDPVAAPNDPSADPTIPVAVPVDMPNLGKEGLVTRSAAEGALAAYLARALSDQGSQAVRITPAVRAAVVKIGATDPALAGKLDSYLNGRALPGSPRELAAAIGKLLPETLPATSIAHLPTAATTDPKDTQAKSAGDAVGKGVAEQITPAVRKLPLDRATQDQLLDAARSATPDAIIAGVEKILDTLPVDPKLRAAVEAIFAAALKKGAAPMDRQQDGAGSPYAKPAPPSVAPDAPKAPGETIIPSPSIPFDVPGAKPPRKADPPPKPEAADTAAVASVIAGIDDGCLIPSSVRGTPAATDYASARKVARDLANQMDQARRAKRASMTFLLGTQYPSAVETLDAFDQLQAIVQRIGAALPNAGAPLGRVMLQIAPPQGHSGAAMQRQVLLNNGS